MYLNYFSTNNLQALSYKSLKCTGCFLLYLWLWTHFVRENIFNIMILVSVASLNQQVLFCCNRQPVRQQHCGELMRARGINRKLNQAPHFIKQCANEL